MLTPPNPPIRDVKTVASGVDPGGRQLAHAGFAVALSEVKEELVASGFSGEGFALCDVL